MWKNVIILVVLVAICFVEARRGSGGGRRGRGGRQGSRGGVPSGVTSRSEWTRELTSSVSAKEESYTVDDQVYVMSRDSSQLRAAGMMPSKTLYDFSGTSPVVVVKVKRNCFMMDVPQNLTKEALQATIVGYNGQVRALSSTLQLNKTDPSPDQTQSVTGRPAVTHLCGNMPMAISALTANAPPASGGRMKTFKVTSLDFFLNITVTKQRRGGRRNNGSRGGRGGRRGGGRRGNRNQAGGEALDTSQ